MPAPEGKPVRAMGETDYFYSDCICCLLLPASTTESALRRDGARRGTTTPGAASIRYLSHIHRFKAAALIGIDDQRHAHLRLAAEVFLADELQRGLFFHEWIRHLE